MDYVTADGMVHDLFLAHRMKAIDKFKTGMLDIPVDPVPIVFSSLLSWNTLLVLRCDVRF